MGSGILPHPRFARARFAGKIRRLIQAAELEPEPERGMRKESP